MPPTSVPQTETFGKMASFFRHEHHADGCRRHEDGQHDEHDAHGDFAAAAARFFLFRSRLRLGAGRTAARRLLLPGHGRRWDAACFGAAARRAAASLCAERLAPLRRAEALLRCEIRPASRRAAPLRLEVLPLRFHLLESLSFPVKIGLFEICIAESLRLAGRELGARLAFDLRLHPRVVLGLAVGLRLKELADEHI